MPIPPPALVADPRFFLAVQQGAQALLRLHDEDPRVGALFSSQQRWLMCHAGYALACTSDGDQPANSLYAARFIDLLTENNVASRNTAADFIKEIVDIGFAHAVEQHGDRRKRLLQLTEVTHRSMSHWLELHLSLLDGLDGGNRAESFRSDPAMIRRLQPRVAGQLLLARGVRSQGPAFDLFTWTNAGGMVMDQLIASIETGGKVDGSAGERLPAGTVSLNDVSRRFNISRTHVKRLFDKAAEMGDFGWNAGRGQSAVWVSRRLLLEYLRYQAEKYAIVDMAFHEVIDGVAAAPIQPSRA
ncbi:hypothetical protein [Mycoplana sp. BE70]|uniref:hypothetical protein n=1 Tax=Mycoplana sp. BE70 TaxID=2817775 RepID=UPI00286B9921|nr:hypothetical protein [Mycoplana sp. BE70]